MKTLAKKSVKESPLFWPARLDDEGLKVLDETLIPGKLHYINVSNVTEAVDVIRTMKTRAFGQFLVVLNSFLLELNQMPDNATPHAIVQKMKKVANALNKSRPTFPFSEVTSIVVSWAEKAQAEGTDMRTFLSKNIHGYLEGIKYRRLERVGKIAGLIKDGDSVLTHCNVSGELAMAAAICIEEGKSVRFFATETRPYFQGAKLTVWELAHVGAKVTLIADNAVGSVMMDGLVNKVIVGSDRSCANGDFANKIGTYQIAVMAKEFKIPFYVMTQPSNKVPSGKDIPIEVRDESEVLTFNGKRMFPESVKAYYPGFDVVPHNLITKTIPINAY